MQMGNQQNLDNDIVGNIQSALFSKKEDLQVEGVDRKSTRLNSSHVKRSRIFIISCSSSSRKSAKYGTMVHKALQQDNIERSAYRCV